MHCKTKPKQTPEKLKRNDVLKTQEKIYLRIRITHSIDQVMYAFIYVKNIAQLHCVYPDNKRASVYQLSFFERKLEGPLPGASCTTKVKC